MPAERLEMRRVREILRYRFEQGLGHKSIAVRVGAAPSTVRETLRRATVAGLSWPLDDDVSDAVLEAALYKAAGTKTGLNDLLAPFMLEVDIDIRLLVAFLADEALEEKVVGRRVDRGDAENIADGAIGGRSPALAENAWLLAKRTIENTVRK